MSFKTRLYIHAGAVIAATALWYTGFWAVGKIIQYMVYHHAR